MFAIEFPDIRATAMTPEPDITDVPEIIIDNFDQWTNPDNSWAAPTICNCVRHPSGHAASAS